MERLNDDTFVRRTQEGSVTVTPTGKINQWIDVGSKNVALGDLLTTTGPTNIEQISGQRRWSKYNRRMPLNRDQFRKLIIR